MEIDFYFEATESFPCVSGGFPYPQPCSCSSIYSNAYLSRAPLVYGTVRGQRYPCSCHIFGLFPTGLLAYLHFRPRVLTRPLFSIGKFWRHF